MEKVFHILKVSSIYTATVILMLHTFVPHSHDKNTDDPEISCENNDRCIREFLGVILEHDFGVDHLEHFQIQDNLHVDFDFYLDNDEVAVHDLFSEFKNWNYSEQVFQNQSVDIGQERGPPFYS